MVFSSPLFIFLFLPITLLLYYCAYRLNITLANIVLLLLSMFFYAWGGIKFFLILLFVITANYFLVRIMQNKKAPWRTLLFLLILAIDVGNLFYFKYYNFFAETIQTIGKLMGYQIWENVGKVALPIGISFYSFQIISYVADVYTGKVEMQKDLTKFALYVLMFPQLIAGPIVRYKDINQELNNRSISICDIEYGIGRFIIGFAKKVFIANAMGSMADTVFAIGEINTVYAWLGAICYALQIYYDFSAYSDMAIGIGRMLGFHFQENFNLPYRSKSIQEFWRRWHISLLSWFRDYVYIPLGGNRKGKVRTYLNLAVVFLLTGLWHGAAWQFIIWGVYHGLFLVIERLGFNKVLDKIPSAVRHVYAMVVVIVGWVFFRADDLPKALVYLRNMFSWNLGGFKQYLIVEQFSSLFWICLIVAIFFAIVDCKQLAGIKIWSTSEFLKISYLVLWGLSVLYLIGLSYNPFIYFKF